MSHRHLIYVPQSEAALLTQQDAAGSCSPWVPLSPPATFPQNKLNSQPVGVQLIFFFQLIEKPYFVCINSFLSICQERLNCILAGPTRFVLLNDNH